MKNDKIENKILYIFLFSIVILQVIYIFLNETTLGGTDNVTHFQTARYAFKYPQLFLDHWGKPLYTALSAPFAYFGFKMAQLFNVIIAVLTLLLSYKISKYLHPSGAIFTVVLIAFAPIYFLLMTTCLTEVLFSFVLVASVYLFIQNRFVFSAIILSFIPFVRNEGLILFPIFALAFILKQKYLSIPFLFSGAIFYSIIGYFVFDDFFWIINRFPHSMEDNIYGSGELLHFVKNSNYIFGIPLVIMVLIGLIFWCVEIIRKFQIRNESFILFIIIAGSWMAYFAAHSFVWWQGLSSLGLIRVIGGVIPLAALTGAKGIQFIFEKTKNRKVAVIILSLVSVIQIFMFFNQNKVPTKAGPIENLITKSAEFVKNEYPDRKIYYFNTEFPFNFKIDPYDQTKSNWGIGDKIQPSNSMNYGDILIWDAHFGPNEGSVQLESVENDPFLERVKSFYPLEKVTVLGGYDYSIQVFEKTKTKTKAANAATHKVEKVLSFENISDQHVIEVDGKKVWRMAESDDYSPNLLVLASDIIQTDVLDFEISLQFHGIDELNKDEVLLVFSVENEGQVLRYEKLDLICAVSEWREILLKTRIPANLPESTNIKMYIWNKNKKRVEFSKLSVSVVSN